MEIKMTSEGISRIVTFVNESREVDQQLWKYAT